MAKTKNKNENPELEKAELRQAIADAKKAEIEAEREAFDLMTEKLHHSRREEQHAKDTSSDFDNLVLNFRDSVNVRSVASFRATLAQWHRTRPGAPFTITINSGGGGVFEGFEMIDLLERMKADGHRITTIITGVAASMAGVVAQAGDERVIGRNSYIHLHEVSTGMMGNASELEDVGVLARRLTHDAAKIYASRTDKYSAEQVHDMMKRKEVYLNAEECLEAGFVDRIGE